MTEVRANDTRERMAEANAATWQIGTTLAGRFQLIELLGRGGFGNVYRALDAKANTVVAVKQLRVTSPEALLSFKQEFRSLARVAHRNLVSLFELHAGPDDWFFTMEFVDGVSLLEHVHGTRLPIDLGAATDAQTASFDSVPVDPALRIRAIDTRVLDAPQGGNVTASVAISPALIATVALRSGPLTRERSGAPALQGASGPSPVRDMEALRRALAQIGEGLAWLHESGRLHRDVKPSNTRVEPGGRTVVLDFGLVQDLGSQLAPVGSGSVVGTPAYMAPELVLGNAATAASDWYSFGVLLFEALTGHYPFNGSLDAMLRAKVTWDALAPSEFVTGVPADLDRLCVALLARDPAERPSATAVLDALGVVRGAPPEVSLGSTRPFVGRDGQLHALAGALDASRSGTNAVALVAGLSGMGKSMLVERFLSSRDRTSTWVLAGRCYERESVAFKALDSVVDALARLIAMQPDAAVVRLVPAGIHALAHIFPALGRLAAFAPDDGTTAVQDERQRLRTAARALRDLLGAIARERTVVLVIDDVQWGDEDSLALLAEILRGPDAPAILLVCMYRSDEVETSPFLRRFLAPGGAASLAGRVVHVAVEALGPDDARDLAVRLGLGELATDLARESSGCPLFIDELTRHARTGDNAGGTHLALDDAIRARVAAVPEASRRYLEVVAIAGRPVSDGIVRAAADLRTMDPKDRHVLEHGHLVRSRATDAGDQVESWHDRVRQSVVAGLDATTARTHHLHLAEALEAGDVRDAAQLADHFEQGAAPGRALPYAIEAADRAADALAFDHAARYYRRAIELSDDASNELRLRYAHALRNAGRGHEAARAFIDAADRAPSDEALALRIQATEQYLFTGEFAAGEQVIRETVARAGLSLAPSIGWSMASFAWGTLRLKLRGLEFDERVVPGGEPDASLLRKVDILWSATIGMSMASPLESQAIQKRHLMLALRSRDPRRVLRAYCVELAFSGMQGGSDERVSDDLNARANSLAERLPDAHGRAFTLMAYGAVHWLRGRWPEAHDHTSRAAARFRAETTGSTWEVDTSQFVALDTLAHMGRWGEIRAQFPALLADALERGDRFLETQLRTRFSWLAGLMEDAPARGRDELDAAIRRWTATGFHIVHFWELTGQVWSRLYEGDGAGAMAVIESRRKALRGSMMLFGQYYRALFLDVEARALVAAARQLDGAPREKALERAAKNGRKLLGEKMQWTAAHGHAVLGAVARARSDGAAARVHFVEAEQGFEAVGMRLHAAAVSRRIGELTDGDDGPARIAAADAVFTREGVAKPERMVATLVP